MKKLKVTWMSGAWNADDVATDSAEIPADAVVDAVGGDTLVFKTRGPATADSPPRTAGICLAIPASRLISAFVIEVAE